MYLLSGITYGNGRDATRYETVVAIFDNEKGVEKYVKAVTLDNGKFRRDSLLSSYTYYDVKEQPILDVPVNPKPPTNPPQVEYIIKYTGEDGRISRVNCGRKRSSVEEEIKSYGKRFICQLPPAKAVGL